MSDSSLRSQCVPAPVPETAPQQEDKSTRTLPLSHYISRLSLPRGDGTWDPMLARYHDFAVTFRPGSVAGNLSVRRMTTGQMARSPVGRASADC